MDIGKEPRKLFKSTFPWWWQHPLSSSPELISVVEGFIWTRAYSGDTMRSKLKGDRHYAIWFRPSVVFGLIRSSSEVMHSPLCYVMKWTYPQTCIVYNHRLCVSFFKHYITQALLYGGPERILRIHEIAIIHDESGDEIDDVLNFVANVVVNNSRSPFRGTILLCLLFFFLTQPVINMVKL